MAVTLGDGNFTTIRAGLRHYITPVKINTKSNDFVKRHEWHLLLFRRNPDSSDFKMFWTTAPCLREDKFRRVTLIGALSRSSRRSSLRKRELVVAAQT